MNATPSGNLPVRHMSIRVPWSDIGWTGHICRNPKGNHACMALNRISQDREDDFEQSMAGKAWSELPMNRLPPCAEEHGAFMSSHAYVRCFNHPYVDFEERYKGFLPTTFEHPAYSAACIPYAWMLREKVENTPEGGDGIAAKFGVEFDASREPILKFGAKTWVQERENQLALLDTFFSAAKPELSLCFFYAKATPLSEDPRRVIIGVGRVKAIDSHKEYEHKSDKRPSSIVWERNIHHSIRSGFEDGFILPYHRLIEIAKRDETFDLKSRIAFAPDENFEAFSYGTEHLTNDEAIASLLSVLRTLEQMPSEAEFDVTRAVEWVNSELNRIWKMRGPFPGLGSALEAFGVSHGTLVAMEIERALRDENGEWREDPWELVATALRDPMLLPGAARRYLGIKKLALYEKLKEERRTILTLLSRFALSAEQATRFFEPVERKLAKIEASDAEIIDNPYLLFEADRRALDPVGLETIDRGIFPNESILSEFPLPGGEPIVETDDPRRVRALAIDVLERCAREEGSTLLPKEELISRIRSAPVEPKCSATTDLFDHWSAGFEPEIIESENVDGLSNFQISRLSKVGNVIRRAINRRIKAARHEGHHNWRGLVDGAVGSPIEEGNERDEAGRTEKSSALEEIFASRVSVLVGPAGTGKTTLLKALIETPEVKKGGVLFLAPTGKARVRLEQVTRSTGAQTIAQFLLKWNRYSAATGEFSILGPVEQSASHETVVIDEASMLTEEQLAATLDAIKGVQRFILVGDTRQLPPIGAGRPFVDIARKLEVQGRGYAELRVQQRQESGERRLDTLLASWFTDRRDDPESDVVWDKIRTGAEGAGVEFVQWETPSELQDYLANRLERTFGDDPDDQHWFEKSIGGSEYQDNIYFRFGSDGVKGAGSSAENWQILSPVWGREWGVEALNDHVHRKFRGDAIERALSQDARSRKIPQPAGPQRIIYGDKVINVRNARNKNVWPKTGALEYVANGEIGSVVGKFKGKNFRGAPKDLEVEFSTQPGFKYTYWKNKLDSDEGSPPLQLAYAITIHKSQGSEFSRVFLILPANSPLISRELLYTALTRHRKELTVFHQGDVNVLKTYSLADNSEIARRLTNLFADPRPIPVTTGGATKLMEASLVHRTESEEFVRSKSEVIVANILSDLGMEYAYEKRFEGSDGSARFPDFTVEDDDTGDTVLIEHLGMLADPGYKRAWEKKLAWYEANGVTEAGGARARLVITRDGLDGSIDAAGIKQLLEGVFG